MPIKPDLPEITSLLAWLPKNLPRSPRQLNHLNEADCELLRLNARDTLAVTIDTIGDEIHSGLYQDPELIGWMSAVVSLSDLAAVGAAPLGLLLSANWSRASTTDFKRRFGCGFQAALKAAGTFWLGGDSGLENEANFSSVGIGRIDTKPILRTQIQTGDVLVLTRPGSFGLGPALGFDYVLHPWQRTIREKTFRPCPDFKTILEVRPILRAGIDTSDGLFACLNILAQLNRVSFDLHLSETLFHPIAVRFCRQAKLPLTTLAYGEHGDYQQIFAVRAANAGQLKKWSRHFTIFAKARKKTNAHRQIDVDGRMRPVRFDLTRDLPRDSLDHYRTIVECAALECKENKFI